jgi:hypothetical protein
MIHKKLPERYARSEAPGERVEAGVGRGALVALGEGRRERVLLFVATRAQSSSIKVRHGTGMLSK